MRSYTGVPNMPSSLDLIVNLLHPEARKRSARSVIVKLVFAASCYYIWQERNHRLFKNEKRSEDQVIKVIKSTVRLKLLSCKFKKTKNVEYFLHLWKLPSSLIRAGFNMSSKVQDVVSNGSWKWPNEWLLKYPSLYTLTVPVLVPNSLDRLVWKSRNDVDYGFSVATVWECIRPRGVEIDWYNLVWFSHNIPWHSIHLWLVIQRKLKTQDKMRQWDVSSNTNLNLLKCPLCERQPDSHDHLFFECIFSLQV
ncbi:reverse transcriptase domain, reverse transcriptase zinc-binding domain protein [Tanacetum coccineum]